MTHPSTIARDSAQHCEAKKHALRQTQDGIVVAFVLHPNDVPASLQLAPLGTRYMLALVEIGEDETPVTRKEAMPSENSSRTPEKSPASEPDPPVRAQPRKWDEITPAQQAGIRCNEPAFVKFLNEEYRPPFPITSTDEAAFFVCTYCKVESRADIRNGEPLAAWDRLENKYRSWLYAPQVGAA